MALPLVIREETAGFRKFKTYWHGQMVDAAIFKGHFYRIAAEFEEQSRVVGYRDAIQLGQTCHVLISIRNQNQSSIYTVWVDQWYEAKAQEKSGQQRAMPFG